MYETFLSPEVEGTFYGPPKRKTVVGKEEYAKIMIELTEIYQQDSVF